MLVLSASEVEELVEHLSARSDIWTLHQEVWVRALTRMEGEGFALALKVRNGLPHGMYGLTTKAVSWSQDAAEDYVVWLLEKYTAYAQRRQVLKLVQSKTRPDVDVDALSRDLCELHGGEFVRKHGQR